MAKPKRVAKQTKKPIPKPSRKPTRPRAAPAPAPVEAPEPASTLPAARTPTPERAFAARVKPPAPTPPLPPRRPATFLDVGESIRPPHLSPRPDHLPNHQQDRPRDPLPS